MMGLNRTQLIAITVALCVFFMLFWGKGSKRSINELLPILPQNQFAGGYFSSNSKKNGRCASPNFNLKTVVRSYMGNVSYERVLEEVYKPFGFTLNQDIMCGSNSTFVPFIPLKVKDMQCERVFADWLTVNDVPVTNKIVWNMPEEKKWEYTLHNFTKTAPHILNDAHNNEANSTLHWTLPLIQKEKDALRDNKGGYPYGSNRGLVFNAFKNMPPKGHGLVVGSIEPWVEGFALQMGADSLVTAEYQRINSSLPQIVPKHPIDIAKNWKEFRNFDFVISFSSMEHSGLGRYGDALDPIGDLREAQKIYCLLKTGGIFYIGLPSGPDEVAWNAHRIYGWIRWPLIAASYEVVNVFDGDISAKPMDPRKLMPSSYNDVLFALKKV